MRYVCGDARNPLLTSELLDIRFREAEEQLIMKENEYSAVERKLADMQVHARENENPRSNNVSICGRDSGEKVPSTVLELRSIKLASPIRPHRKTKHPLSGFNKTGRFSKRRRAVAKQCHLPCTLIFEGVFSSHAVICLSGFTDEVDKNRLTTMVVELGGKVSPSGKFDAKLTHIVRTRLLKLYFIF